MCITRLVQQGGDLGGWGTLHTWYSLKNSFPAVMSVPRLRAGNDVVELGVQPGLVPSVQPHRMIANTAAEKLRRISLELQPQEQGELR